MANKLGDNVMDDSDQEEDKNNINLKHISKEQNKELLNDMLNQQDLMIQKEIEQEPLVSQ